MIRRRTRSWGQGRVARKLAGREMSCRDRREGGDGRLSTPNGGWARAAVVPRLSWFLPRDTAAMDRA